MPYTVLVHILNEEAVVGEVDKLPEPVDQVLIIKNPRYRDGREVSYILPEATAVIYPWTRIHCVEVMPGEEEAERVITFVRE